MFPALRELSRRYSRLSELDADDAAVLAARTPRPLAAARRSGATEPPGRSTSNISRAMAGARAGQRRRRHRRGRGPDRHPGGRHGLHGARADEHGRCRRRAQRADVAQRQHRGGQGHRDHQHDGGRPRVLFVEVEHRLWDTAQPCSTSSASWSPSAPDDQSGREAWTAVNYNLSQVGSRRRCRAWRSCCRWGPGRDLCNALAFAITARTPGAPAVATVCGVIVLGACVALPRGARALA